MPGVTAVLKEVEAAKDEIVDFAAELVRVPTENPPGQFYRDCAELLGRQLELFGFDAACLAAGGRPEHTPEHPRINVIGHKRGGAARPLIHLNGHLDVVPPGDGWTVDPFEGLVRDGRLYGRGSADMKGGIAAAVFATEAIRRAGISLRGSIEVSGTVDEESGGYAGLAWLAEHGRIHSSRTDYVIIPEPFGVDRICIGHRGVYWFKVTAHGRIAHGSMPFLGVNAIEQMGALLDAIRSELVPALEERTTEMPVVPPQARLASINTNTVEGGQAGARMQTPCVADRCEAIFDRRFLLEEGFEKTRAEIATLIERTAAKDPNRNYQLQDLMVFHPVMTPEGSPLTAALQKAIGEVVGRQTELVASPGTYDHKHVARIAGVEHCVAYGPGTLEIAHQADEYCSVEDLVTATQVLALTILELTGTKE
jgi:succinyl-diaminopimelate desuccinylase